MHPAGGGAGAAAVGSPGQCVGAVASGGREQQPRALRGGRRDGLRGAYFNMCVKCIGDRMMELTLVDLTSSTAAAILSRYNVFCSSSALSFECTVRLLFGSFTLFSYRTFLRIHALLH